MNLFKRAARRIGRFFKFRHDNNPQPELTLTPDQDLLTQSNAQESNPAEGSLEDAIDQVSSELLALNPDRISDNAETPWSEDTLLATLSGDTIDKTNPDASAESDLEPITYTAEPAKMVEAVFDPAPEGPVVEDLATINLDQVRPIVEHKEKPSVTFTELFEMISSDVGKRSDKAVDVYERLLAATREELEATRKSSRLAWSVGGVMTAVAAMGGVWSAAQIGATRNEVGALKNQVAAAQQISQERDRINAELLRLGQASAKLEIEALKSRLDHAVAVSAERDRLRHELAAANKARADLEAELKTAQAQTVSQKVAAATQPVSAAPAPTLRPDKPLTIADKSSILSTKALAVSDNRGQVDGAIPALTSAARSEQSDVWSALLNGR